MVIQQNIAICRPIEVVCLASMFSAMLLLFRPGEAGCFGQVDALYSDHYKHIPCPPIHQNTFLTTPSGPTSLNLPLPCMTPFLLQTILS